MTTFILELLFSFKFSFKINFVESLLTGIPGNPYIECGGVYGRGARCEDKITFVVAVFILFAIFFLQRKF